MKFCYFITAISIVYTCLLDINYTSRVLIMLIFKHHQIVNKYRNTIFHNIMLSYARSVLYNPRIELAYYRIPNIKQLRFSALCM